MTDWLNQNALAFFFLSNEEVGCFHQAKVLSIYLILLF